MLATMPPTLFFELGGPDEEEEEEEEEEEAESCCQLLVRVNCTPNWRKKSYAACIWTFTLRANRLGCV